MVELNNMKIISTAGTFHNIEINNKLAQHAKPLKLVFIIRKNTVKPSSDNQIITNDL